MRIPVMLVSCAVAAASWASAVTQEVVMVRSDGSITAPGALAAMTNVSARVVTNHVNGGYLCTTATAQQMTNATLTAAKQDAAEKYLPLTGGEVSGNLDVSYLYADSIEADSISGTLTVSDYYSSFDLVVGSDIEGIQGNSAVAFQKNSSMEQSWIIPDGTRVMTAGAVSNYFPIVTNAYTKAYVDTALEYKASFYGGSGIYITRDGSYITKSGGGGFYVVEHGGGTTFIPTGKGDVIASDDISHTNPTFSNEVLAVGMSVNTNLVSAINEMAGTSISTTTGATTVGGLLAALAAAVAFLKRKKFDKITCTGVADITTDNGSADVSSLFTSANTSLNNAIDAEIAARCASLDPNNSSIADIIKALKGID